MAILFKTELKIANATRPFKTTAILSDTFFESQNFKHSFTFEFV